MFIILKYNYKRTEHKTTYKIKPKTYYPNLMTSQYLCRWSNNLPILKNSHVYGEVPRGLNEIPSNPRLAEGYDN